MRGVRAETSCTLFLDLPSGAHLGADEKLGRHNGVWARRQPVQQLMRPAETQIRHASDFRCVICHRGRADLWGGDSQQHVSAFAGWPAEWDRCTACHSRCSIMMQRHIHVYMSVPFRQQQDAGSRGCRPQCGGSGQTPAE